MSRKKLILRVVQALVIGLILYYLVYKNLILKWQELGQSDWQVNWLYFSASVIGISLVYVINALIWKSIVRSISGVRVSPLRAANIWFVSNLGRYIPGKIWQIAGMAAMARSSGVPAIEASLSAVIGQLVHLMAGAVVGLVMMSLDPLAGFAEYLDKAWILALPALMFLYPPLLEKLVGLAARLSGRQEVSCRVSFGNLLSWFVMNLGVWLAYGGLFHLFVLSMLPDATLSVVRSAGIYAVGYITGFLAVFVPGGIGVRELMFAELLAGSASSEASATLVALASRVWLTLAEIVPVLIVIILSGVGTDKNKK